MTDKRITVVLDRDFFNTGANFIRRLNKLSEENLFATYHSNLLIQIADSLIENHYWVKIEENEKTLVDFFLATEITIIETNEKRCVLTGEPITIKTLCEEKFLAYKDYQAFKEDIVVANAYLCNLFRYATDNKQ